MRELIGLEVNGLNETLTIQVLDEPGQGNACHQYVISRGDAGEHGFSPVKIGFQNGPIREIGVNGISNEALLAIVEDRLQGFQFGDYACRENALALVKLQEAMMWLHKRSLNRVARGVEGTNEK